MVLCGAQGGDRGILGIIALKSLKIYIYFGTNLNAKGSYILGRRE